MIQITELENGLRIVTEAMTDAESVSMSYWVGTGSRDERANEAGLSHFLEHLLFKGSKTRTSLEIAQAIDAIGGEMNAFTTKECTSFYLRVLADDCDNAHEILTDIMCEPGFDATEVDSERKVVLEEMLMRGDEPSDLVYENYARAAFVDHPLGREILGDEALIEGVRPDEIASFFDGQYGANNVVFAAAGKLDHEAMVERVARSWCKSNRTQRRERSVPQKDPMRVISLQRDTEQLHMVLGVRAPNRHDMRRYAASLLDTVLGGGMSSRLVQEVREKRGLAYSVYSSYGSFDDAGDFSIYAGTVPGSAHETLSVLQTELQRLPTDVSPEELDRAKKHLRATMVMGLEDAGSRMSRIGRSLLMHGEVLMVNEVLERIERVTLDEVRLLAQELAEGPHVLSVVGPNADVLAKSFA